MNNNIFKPLLTAVLTAAAVSTGLAADILVTDTYRWHGDTITQGEFMATAPTETSIVSTYSAQPGYGFPIDKTWNLKNDISAYPRLITPDKLHTAIYNMGLDEMVNAVEPDTTLRTGKEWGGVWTRDVSYSILLSMAQMQPEAARISLMKKVTPGGVIVQDTGSGGAWPISSDREIWTLAAYELYKVTGDREWLEYIYPVISRSLADDELTVSAPSGLVRGETSFIDWREQSYPKWMQTADIYTSEALNTSIVHVQALRTLAAIARELGNEQEAIEAERRAQTIADAINNELWMDDKGYYAMYRYGRNNLIVNPRAETLGESLAILYDIAPEERAIAITENNPTTPFGTAIFYPQIADMPAYHNNALWPWVGAYWALANAKAGNEPGTLQAIGSVFRPAALFATNKENFNLDNGDIATELNSSNMLWCLAGNIAITQRILFGITYETDGLSFHPFVPQALGQERSLLNYPYRNASLNITVKGYGDSIASFTLNGRPHAPFLPADITDTNNIEITLSDSFRRNLTVNNVPNAKAPLTPITHIEDGMLVWNPIEYIAGYKVIRNGAEVARTRQTSYAITEPGEYQVIGISAEGIESFASEPLSTNSFITVQMPNEGTAMISEEISYQPQTAVEGFTGEGFVEIDRASAPIEIPFSVPDAGTYSITLRYANGNGPVNTENKAAIRTASVDGERLGIIVMPHRGVANWDDWGRSSAVEANLTPGNHTLKIDFRPENNNMNGTTNHALIDLIRIEKVR